MKTRMSKSKVGGLVFTTDLDVTLGTYSIGNKKLSITFPPMGLDSVSNTLVEILEEIGEIENNPDYFVRFLE